MRQLSLSLQITPGMRRGQVKKRKKKGGPPKTSQDKTDDPYAFRNLGRRNKAGHARLKGPRLQGLLKFQLAKN
jgi:hypothetical protein